MARTPALRRVLGAVANADAVATDDASDQLIVERGGNLVKVPADVMIQGGGISGEPMCTTQVGDAGACFYPLGSHDNGATVGNPGVDKLHAFPFAVPRRIVLSTLAINVRTPDAGGELRMGIYAATSAGNPFPGGLLYDAGAIDSAADGIKTVAPDLTLSPNRIYWFASLLKNNQSMTCLVWSSALLYPFGVSVLDNTGIGLRGPLRVNRAYGALPATFPTAGLLIPAANASGAIWPTGFAQWEAA